MIEKTISFTDYNGVKRTETHYFNLNKAEVVQMEIETPGGMQKYIEDIIAAQNAPELIRTFKKILDMSYGVKSPDGREFIKNEEVLNKFRQTEAYSDLYMELVQDEKAAADFIKGVLPSTDRAESNNKVTAIPQKPNIPAPPIK